MAVNTCPGCGAAIPNEPGYSPWCDQCNWNLAPPPPPATVLERLYAGLGAAGGVALAKDASQASGLVPRVTGAKACAFLMAAATYLLLGALLVGGGLLLVAGWPNPFALVFGCLCLGLAWLLRPRAPVCDEGPMLAPARFPALYGLVAALGEKLGARPVAGIVVNASFNASLGQQGWRRSPVMVLGLPLWTVLTPSERVALLTHELAHDVNGDVLRGAFVGNAMAALFAFARLLRPDAIVVWGAGLGGLLAAPFNLVLSLLSKSAWAVGAILCHLLWHESQRAEHYADILAAKVSGTVALRSLLTKMHLSRTFELGLHELALSRDPNRDLFAELAARAEIVPPRQLERLRRIETLTGIRLDATHPPTRLRMEVLAMRPDLPSEGEPLAVHWEGLENELGTLRRGIQQQVLDAYRAQLYH